MTTMILQSELYPTKWRQDYVARIVGPDFRYRVERVFCERGKRNGTYGALVVDRGVYESRIAGVKRWELYGGNGKWTGLPDISELARRLTGDRITQLLRTLETLTPADWDEHCAFCAATVQRFTADGWPVCDDCYEHVGEPDWLEVVDLSDMEVPF